MADALSVVLPAFVGAVVVASVAVILLVTWEKKQRMRQQSVLIESMERLEEAQTLLQWQRDFDRETIKTLQETLTREGRYSGPTDGIVGPATIAAARSMARLGMVDVLTPVVGPETVTVLTQPLTEEKIRRIPELIPEKSGTRVSLRGFGHRAA